MVSPHHCPCHVPAGRGHHQAVTKHILLVLTGVGAHSCSLSGIQGKLFSLLSSVCPDMDVQRKKFKNKINYTFDFFLHSLWWVLAAVYPHGSWPVTSALPRTPVTRPDHCWFAYLSRKVGHGFPLLISPPCWTRSSLQAFHLTLQMAFLLEFSGAQALWREGPGLLNQRG